MRRTIHLALVAAMAFSAVAAHDPDLEDHPCYDAEADALVYPEQQVWFHEGDSKLGNGSAAAPFDTTKPTTSVTGGAGAGTVSPGFATLGNGQDQWAHFSGTFTGCIDTIAVDLYSFNPTNRSGHGGVTGAPGCLPECTPKGQPAQHDFGYQLIVDGITILSTEGTAAEALTTHDYEGFGPNLNQFALDVRTISELYGAALTLDGEHTVELKVRSWYVNTDHGVYVWDTSEVPSGMTFNGAVPEGVPFVG